MLKQLNNFVKFAAKELDLKTLPKIHFVDNSEDKYRAFGHSLNSDIYIRITDRHPDDIMRTITHELVHQKQADNKSEQSKEDEANAVAGRVMRKFNTTHPSVFKLKPINNLKETESVIPANASAGEGVAKFDPLLGSVRRKPKNFPI